MKDAVASRLLVLACGVCFALVLISGSRRQNSAANPCTSGTAQCPYFKVTGGDVFAGGWFGSSCLGANYQSSSASTYSGGIMADAKESGSNAAGGASSQYDAYALGSIQGDSTSDYGFYTDGAAAGANVSQLSFSNSPLASASWGGNFEGSAGLHCIPDYFTTEQNSPTDLGSQTSFDINSLTAAQSIMTAGTSPIDLTDSGTVPAGGNLTLFVKGDVYIDSNITYAAHTAANVPKFALVVSGNIYLGPDVTELDGFYVAEPDLTSGANGEIWTCHPDNEDTSVDSTFIIIGGCHTNTLTINGAMVAKQVNLLRTVGDVNAAAATAGENPATSGNVSEIFNYTPEMVIGGPFFNGTPPNAVINSLISLPPVY